MRRRPTARRSRTLYRRYLDRVYGYCFYLLGDHHDAEDATERTFVAALGAIDRYRDEGATFRAWLFRIAHNQLANALRAREPPPTTAARRRAGAGRHVGDPARTGRPRRRRPAAARRASQRSPRIGARSSMLRFVDGLSAREIGAVLGRSEGAVRVLQHRALRDLAALLEGRAVRRIGLGADGVTYRAPRC